MRLNKHPGSHFGKAAYGYATVSIHGAVPAPLVGKAAGMHYGPPWLDANNVIYQNCSDGPCRIQSINVDTLALTARDPTGANQLTAGGGGWQAFLASMPSLVRTHDGTTYSGAVVLDATPDGRYVLLDNYQAGTGLTVYSATGTVLFTRPGLALAGGATVRLGGNILAYKDATGWHLVDITNGRTPTWVARTDGVGICIPIPLSTGGIVVLERSEFLTIRRAESAMGFVVEPAPISFSPDAMLMAGSTYRVGYCVNEGESVDSLKLVDVDLTTGAQQIGVVSGGTVVWSAGLPLTPSSFPVAPEGVTIRTVDLAGAFADVVQHPEGWALAYIDHYNVICLVNGIERWRYVIVPPPEMEGVPIFIRCACDPAGNVRVSCTISHTNNFDMVYVIGEGLFLATGLRAKAQRGTLISYEGGTFVVYYCDTKDSYVRYPLSGVPGPSISMGLPDSNPMGFLDRGDDGIITWACNATATSYNIVTFDNTLFYLPNVRSGVTVGQAQGEPATREGILAHTGAGIATVIHGKGFEPHLARITAGPDAGNYIFVATMLHHVVRYAIMPAKGLTGGGGSAATIPPVNHPVEENGQNALQRRGKELIDGATRMTRPWQGWCHAVRRALTNLSNQMSGLQQAVGEGLAFGKVAVEGEDTVSADRMNDTVTFTSEDGSVVITTIKKIVDFKAVGGGTGPGAGYWSPLSDGDLTQAELIFADGAPIMVWVPTPPPPVVP